jgi:exosortase F-associated protein
MHKIFKYIVLFLLFFSLIMLRSYASDMFYDPLVLYFKNDYLYKSIPKIDKGLYLRDLFFRYFINSTISISIIYVFFKKKNYVLFSVWFYVIAFIILTFLFFLILKEGTSDYKLLFYIRRFLIHPIFLLLLIPIFFQKSRN